MSITEMHKDYVSMIQKWSRCRDFFSGADALRQHDIALIGDVNLAYLPRLSSKQSYEEYVSYVRRALYYNAPARTKDGLRGLIFSRDPYIVLPPGAESIIDDIDLKETPLNELLEEIVDEILEVGRCGVLIDYPVASQYLSRLDEERSGARPFATIYKTEDIINWKMIRVGNSYKLGYLVLKELYTKDDGVEDTLYRELFLELVNGQLIYRNRVWYDLNTIPETITPTMSGQPLTDIPFYFYDAKGGRIKPMKPPLLDLVEVARSHYQTSADLEHASFSCSLPTPYFLGFSEDETSDIALGGLNGIVSINPEAKVGYLEYNGAGIEPLEKRLQIKADMMAKLGSRMLSEDKREAEAAETLKIRASGESAHLSDIANAVGRIMTQMLQFMIGWMGLPNEDIYVELNTEYTPSSASPQEITALLSAVQANKLPIKDFINRLRKVGIIDAERDDEQIEQELEMEELKQTGGALTTGLDILNRARQ